MKAVHKVFDDFLDKVVEEHLQSSDHGERRAKDFVDILLGFMGPEKSEYRIGPFNIKAIYIQLNTFIISQSVMVVEWSGVDREFGPELMLEFCDDNRTHTRRYIMWIHSSNQNGGSESCEYNLLKKFQQLEQMAGMMQLDLKPTTSRSMNLQVD
ncbi:hypothetical protein M0R45_035054 [Rubus argutus]|uniref:Uncharacterized protein n=1 Tax=Rubus argutus TaxID=59490 RepID=A0AAW1VT24_RUBAR